MIWNRQLDITPLLAKRITGSSTLEHHFSFHAKFQIVAMYAVIKKRMRAFEKKNTRMPPEKQNRCINILDNKKNGLPPYIFSKTRKNRIASSKYSISCRMFGLLAHIFNNSISLKTFPLLWPGKFLSITCKTNSYHQQFSSQLEFTSDKPSQHILFQWTYCGKSIQWHKHPRRGAHYLRHKGPQTCQCRSCQRLLCAFSSVCAVLLLGQLLDFGWIAKCQSGC